MDLILLCLINLVSVLYGSIEMVARVINLTIGEIYLKIKNKRQSKLRRKGTEETIKTGGFIA